MRQLLTLALRDQKAKNLNSCYNCPQVGAVNVRESDGLNALLVPCISENLLVSPSHQHGSPILANATPELLLPGGIRSEWSVRQSFLRGYRDVPFIAIRIPDHPMRREMYVA
jgi:hypothetical protein